MFMLGNPKKKKHPLLAVAVGVFAVYGAYSMVCSVKECCSARMAKMMRCMSKKKKSDTSCENGQIACEF